MMNKMELQMYQPNIEIDQEGFPIIAQPVEERFHLQVYRKLYTSRSRNTQENCCCAHTYEHLNSSCHNRYLDEDQESGEATSSSLVVLRTPYNNTDTNLKKYFKSTLYMKNTFSKMYSNEIIFDQNTKYSWNPDENDKKSSHKKEMKLGLENSIIPKINCQSKKKAEIYIPIWKELLMGELIFEESETNYPKLRKKYFPKHKFFQVIICMSKFVPFTIARLILTLLFLLFILLSWVSLEVSFYYRLYIHIMMHKLGETQGHKLVFTGKSSNGPVIYLLRHISCPYCKQQQQVRILNKYFTAMMEERRNMLMNNKSANG
ncbi:unnamed protein product [Meganyctiphanes norvegica]|uniref:Transmembrane protein n=1 Tax=Meganyctiphanes norvegica TaxID=48144 RepID=A0AAV2RH35_MEGNR